MDPLELLAFLPRSLLIQGLDVGPDSSKTISEALSDCKTILWNGPMGGEEAPRCLPCPAST
jgi:hypothetical protein